MNYYKAKGTFAETAVTKFLQENGWPQAERRILHGANDKGDILLTPEFMLEVKNQKTYQFTEWMRETETERVNAGAKFGVLIVKPRGVGESRVGEWWACMPLNQMNLLLKKWWKADHD